MTVMQAVNAQQRDVRVADAVIVESMTATAPSSIALESIEGHLRASNSRMAVIAPAGQSETSADSAAICSFPVTIQAHPNRALVARFDDRFEIEWHPDDPKCPIVRGRVTIRPFGAKTELAFKGWCDLSAVCQSGEAARSEDRARFIVRSVLAEFKAVLERKFATLPATGCCSENARSRMRRCG